MKFLFWCAYEHLDFRIPEFEALAELFDIELNWIEKNQTHPWVILDLPNLDQAKTLCSRSISTKFCAQLWTEAFNFDAFHTNIKQYCDKQKLAFGLEVSFKMQIETFMKRLTMPERLAKIETYDYLPVKGPVKLDNPNVTFMAFEFYGFDHNNLPDEPLQLFFGQFVAEGQRDLITK